jgi:hypothetical protein
MTGFIHETWAMVELSKLGQVYTYLLYQNAPKRVRGLCHQMRERFWRQVTLAIECGSSILKGARDFSGIGARLQALS